MATARPVARWVLAGALLAAAVAAVVLGGRGSRRAGDEQAIAQHLFEMQQMVRAHDARLWLHVETDGHAPSTEHEAAHQAMLRDFERLSHLRGFTMRDVEIEVAGDTALARYRIEAEAKGAERPPVGGELRFGRSAKGWEMTGHTLIEAR